MKKLIKKIIPKPIFFFLVSVYTKFTRFIKYNNYDSSQYWKKRASEPDQAAVLWTNQEYNQLYRKDQKKIIKKYLDQLPRDARVLDIGCGIGIVSKMICDIRDDIIIDAVDFDEMIEIALMKNSHPNINFISSSAEDYYKPECIYDMVISSGCYSAIRNISSLEKAIVNGAKMTKSEGIVLMIDPFHRTNYLARAKYSSRKVITLMKQNSFKLNEKSGVLFIPYREKLANSKITGSKLERKYCKGERLLSILGKHTWADYKILAFKKN